MTRMIYYITLFMLEIFELQLGKKWSHSLSQMETKYVNSVILQSKSY